MAIVYNMRDPVTQQQITTLTLSARLVARIISDTDLIGFFQDPELRALNPGIRFPAYALSQPLLRAEQNADTGITTGWLESNPAAKAFLAGKDPFRIPVNPAWKNVAYPTDVFENRGASTAYLPRHGQAGVVERVFHGVKPPDSTAWSTDYMGFVGVVDLPTAYRYGLPAAKLVNAAGVAVAPNDDSILAGLRSMTRNADGTRVANFAATDPAAYPLVKVDYALVNKTPKFTQKGRAVGNLVKWAVTGGQFYRDPGYTALPADLVTDSWTVVTQLTGELQPIAPVETPAATPTDFSSSSGGSSAAANTSSGTETAAVATSTAAGKDKNGRSATYAPVASYGTDSDTGLVIALALGFVALLAGLVGTTAPRVRSWRKTRSAQRSDGSVDVTAGEGHAVTGVLESAAPLEAESETASETTAPAQGTPRPAPVPASNGSTVLAVASRGLLVLGAIVLLFAGFLFFASAFEHDRDQNQLDHKLTADLALGKGAVGGTIKPGTPIALLEVPDAGIREVVVEGTTSGLTEGGPGHVRATPLPGQRGNSVLIGRHRTFGGPFGSIGGLTRGDRITVTTGQGKSKFRVTRVQHDVALERSTFAGRQRGELTLVTSAGSLTVDRKVIAQAALITKPKQSTPHLGVLTKEELGATGEHRSLWPVVFLLELLLAVALGAVWLQRRYGRWSVYLVAAPVFAAGLWMLFDDLARRLPATL